MGRSRRTIPEELLLLALDPATGYHGAAAVARPRSGRSTASGAGPGGTDSPRRGSYRRGAPTADRRSNSGLRARTAAQTRQSGPGRPLDRRAPAGAAPDVPRAPGALRHGACRAGPDVRGAADDPLPGDRQRGQPGDQGPAGQRDPHRRTAGPADRGARRARPRRGSRQAPVPRQRGAVLAIAPAGPDQVRPDGRSRGPRRDGRAERCRGRSPAGHRAQAAAQAPARGGGHGMPARVAIR